MASIAQPSMKTKSDAVPRKCSKIIAIDRKPLGKLRSGQASEDVSEERAIHKLHALASRKENWSHLLDLGAMLFSQDEKAWATTIQIAVQEANRHEKRKEAAPGEKFIFTVLALYAIGKLTPEVVGGVVDDFAEEFDRATSLYRVK
jgi:hypothetical protein